MVTMAARRQTNGFASRALLAFVLGLGLVLGDAASAAEPKPVLLSEVASRVSAPRLGDVVPLLRAQAEQEIEAIDWKRERVARRVHVSASLVQLESAERSGVLRSSAVVSATLLDAKSGALLGVVQGRAETEGRRSTAALTERDALAGAMRGAISAIPEAMRRMK